MGICQAVRNPTSQEDELQSLTLPNSESVIDEDHLASVSLFKMSQSNRIFNIPIPISPQINLHKLPISKHLSIIYQKCRIERPIEVEGGTYIGQWYCGKQCGYGRMLYHNGDQYEGYWLMGFRHHIGIMHFKNKQPLCGAWFEDRFQGTNTDGTLMKDTNFTMTYSHLLKQQPLSINGTLYYGLYSNQGKQGLGYWIKKEDFIFIGHFKNDQKEGYCIESTKKETFRGYYQNGKRTGLGHLLRNKTIFIGLFENNQPTTNGISIQI